MTHACLTLALTPHGRVVLTASDEAPELDQALAQRLLDAFQRGSGPGLLQLGGAEVGQPLPPVFSYWRELGVRYVTALCTRPGTDTQHTPIPPPDTIAERRREADSEKAKLRKKGRTLAPSEGGREGSHRECRRRRAAREAWPIEGQGIGEREPGGTVWIADGSAVDLAEEEIGTGGGQAARTRLITRSGIEKGR